LLIATAKTKTQLPEKLFYEYNGQHIIRENIEFEDSK